MAVLRRLALAAGLMLAVIVLNFLLIRIAPGDPIETVAGATGGMTEALRASLAHAWGLDLPLTDQLVIYLKKVLQGDLGYSYFFNASVLSLILARIGPTLLLIASSIVFSLLVGVALGVKASNKPNGLFSQLIMVLSVVGYAAPVFWTGIMLMILFASVWPIFPVSGMADIATSMDANVFRQALDILHHLILPMMTLSIIYVAQYSQMTRASMINTLGSDFIRTARAKGVAERDVFYGHALQNAVLPVVTMVGLQFGNVLAGAVLVESVFDWPGMGRLAFESVLRRDYPVILGILLFSAAMVIIANLVTDLAYRYVDPRIRRSDA